MTDFTKAEQAAFIRRELLTIEHIAPVATQYGDEIEDGAINPPEEMPGVYASLAHSAAQSGNLFDFCHYIAHCRHSERFGARDDEEADRAWTKMETIGWAQAASFIDAESGISYKMPVDDAEISLAAIALMASDSFANEALGIGTTMNQIDILARGNGRPVCTALRTLIAHAPSTSFEASKLYALRRPVIAGADEET